MSDPIDLSRLRDLAREATPGPWREWKDQILIGEEWVRDLPTYCDARYLAALSPDVLLALLDRLGRAERERDEAHELRYAVYKARDVAETRARHAEAMWSDALRLNAALRSRLVRALCFCGPSSNTDVAVHREDCSARHALEALS